MVSYVTPKKGVEYITYISLPAQAGNIMQANPTIAAGDFKVSKDGGALANLTTLPVVTPALGKMLKITLTATEMTADNITVIASDVAGAEWNDVSFNVQTTTNQIDDLATQATVDTILVDTNELQVNQGNWLTATGFSTFDPAVDAVATVTTVTNMRGTDSANTVAPDNATISTITGQITALNDITVANVLDGVIEGTTTLKQSLQISNSATGAKLSGAATNTIAVRDLADTKDRITATVDANGNRTVVTRSFD